MRLADLLTAAVLMTVGGVVVYDALRLGIGWGLEGPKGGFLPFWLAVTLMAICAAILVQAARRPGGRPFVTPAQLRPVLAVLGPATAMVALTQLIGLYVASGLYLGFYMRWIGRHSWLAIAAVAIGVPVVSFIVFERWFLVPMPKGPLEDWMGY